MHFNTKFNPDKTSLNQLLIILFNKKHNKSKKHHHPFQRIKFQLVLNIDIFKQIIIINFQTSSIIINKMKSFSYSMGNFKNNHQYKVIPKPQLTKILSQEEHKITQYGMLNRVLTNHLKKKKKKKVKNAIGFRDQFTNEIDHCKSLEKMQSLNSERNEEIKRHIYEKAAIFTENQELKQMLINPSLKEHELHSKIYRLEHEVNNLKLMLEEKDSKHQEEINRLKEKHRVQIQLFNTKITSKNMEFHTQETNQIKYYPLNTNTNKVQTQRQANHIKAINFSPPQNISYSPKNNSYNHPYETDRDKMAKTNTYSPPKNITYHPKENQRKHFLENTNYNPKIVSYQHQVESTNKNSSYSPPKASHSYQKDKNSIYTNHREPVTVSHDISHNNKLNNNANNINSKVIINQQSITFKQATPQIIQLSSQNTKENYIIGTPLYITSKNKQPEQASIDYTKNNYQYTAQGAKNSQNTTQMTLKSNKSEGVITYQVTNPVKSSSYSEFQKASPIIKTSHTENKSNLLQTQKQNPKFNVTSVPYKSSYNQGQLKEYKAYGQNDLQEIYKKYCID